MRNSRGMNVWRVRKRQSRRGGQNESWQHEKRPPVSKWPCEVLRSDPSPSLRPERVGRLSGSQSITGFRPNASGEYGDTMGALLNPLQTERKQPAKAARPSKL